MKAFAAILAFGIALPALAQEGEKITKLVVLDKLAGEAEAAIGDLVQVHVDVPTGSKLHVELKGEATTRVAFVKHPAQQRNGQEETYSLFLKAAKVGDTEVRVHKFVPTEKLPWESMQVFRAQVWITRVRVSERRQDG